MRTNSSISIRNVTTVSFFSSFFPLPSVASAIIMQVPRSFAVITPFESIVAIFELLLEKCSSLLFAFSGNTSGSNFSVCPSIIFQSFSSNLMDVTGCKTLTMQVAVYSVSFNVNVHLMLASPAEMPFTVPRRTVATVGLSLSQTYFGSFGNSAP